MSRTLIICLALVLGLVSTSFGSPANLNPLCNFETVSTWGTSASNTTQGWMIAQWGTQGDTAASSGNHGVGVTLGTGCAKMVKTMNHLATGGATWGWDLEWQDWVSGYNPGGESKTAFHTDLWNALAAGKTLQFDITYDPIAMTQTTGDLTYDTQAYFQIGTTSGGQANLQVEHLAPWNGLSVQTIHVVMDLTAEWDAISGMIAGPSSISYVQLILGDNVGPGWSGKETTYIDNVKIVPEPATMTLLGLGALALIRRKR
jgi:hypothetical protein